MPMKVKKNVRDEIRRPDPIQSFFTDTIDWVRENKNRCIAIAIIAVIVGGAGWGYGYYRSARDEKAQYFLARASGATRNMLATRRATRLPERNGPSRRRPRPARPACVTFPGFTLPGSLY